MTDITLNHMTNGQNISTANTNFDVLQDNINNHSLQKDGGNNVLFQDLDFNGHSLLNGSLVSTSTLKLNGVYVVPTSIAGISPDILAALMHTPPIIGDVTPNQGFFTTLVSTDTTQSTSSTTGALKTAGGLGVVKDIVCGGSYRGAIVSTSGSLDNIPIGNTTPSTGKFTTLSISGPAAHSVLVGEGSGNLVGISPGSAGGMLLSAGAGADPVFGNNPIITGGSINSTPVGSTTPSTGSFTNLTASGTLTGFPGRLINVQVLTSSGTYTPTVGTNSIVVEVQGGGGGGGGSNTTAAGQFSLGGGGASGAYAKSRLTSGFSGATVTVGAAGSAGAIGGTGGTGGNSAFGTITAAGGAGGASIAATAPPFLTNSGSPGVAANGNIINISGTQPPFAQAPSTSYAMSGPGASSPLGSGGGVRAGTLSGAAATGYGSGGGGAGTVASASGQVGGAGAPGVVIIYEFS